LGNKVYEVILKGIERNTRDLKLVCCIKDEEGKKSWGPFVLDSSKVYFEIIDDKTNDFERVRFKILIYF
jgi:hypothetical protein